MDLTQTLKNIGLSEKEAKIYLSLLELQEALPSTIARKANVKRPTTYVVLEQLQKRGLVGYIKKGRLLYFRAQNPHSLIEDQHDKYQTLEKSLPELLQLHEKYTATPQMSVYEGKEGLIKIMEDTLTAKTELLCWADVTLAVTSLKDYYPTYIAKKVKRKIYLRGIFCNDKLALRFKEHSKDELREVHLIPPQKIPIQK
ncbi:MAG: helix-turn-helix domain-containing protein [Patescibacteria group bacterium]